MAAFCKLDWQKINKREKKAKNRVYLQMQHTHKELSDE